MDDSLLGSNHQTKIGALLGTSEHTEDGTADGLLGGYLDDIPRVGLSFAEGNCG